LGTSAFTGGFTASAEPGIVRRDALARLDAHLPGDELEEFERSGIACKSVADLTPIPSCGEIPLDRFTYPPVQRLHFYGQSVERASSSALAVGGIVERVEA
jgi:hypothetical protein